MGMEYLGIRENPILPLELISLTKYLGGIFYTLWS